MQQCCHYCYQYYQHLLKTAIVGLKEICCSCDATQGAEGHSSLFLKQGVFKRYLSLLQPWGALPAVQRTADGRHSHQAADGQVSGEGGHPRLSVHTGRTWGAALCEQQKHQAAERLCLSAHHKPFITPVGFWECLFFLRYFEGMASPSSRLLYGIKITKHNPNTAHFSNAFLEINVLSSSPFEMKM